MFRPVRAICLCRSGQSIRSHRSMTTCSVPTQPRRASRRLRRVGRALIALAAAAAFIPAGGHPATAASTTASSVAAVFDGKALQGIPAKVRGGITELSLKNTGAFPVDLQFVRIQGARTDAAVAKALNADEAPPAWMEGFGGTNKAAAGTTARATVNLDKGTYLWVVLAGGSELDGKAPFGRFVVNGPKSSVPPSGSATVVALDYSFRATGLRTGINRVAFRNDGKERHHVLMFRMKPGRTIDNVRKEVASDVQGPPQTV